MVKNSFAKPIMSIILRKQFQETLSYVFAKSSLRKIKSCLDFLAHMSTKKCLKCNLSGKNVV
jgi:hypothetical protein